MIPLRRTQKLGLLRFGLLRERTYYGSYGAVRVKSIYIKKNEHDSARSWLKVKNVLRTYVEITGQWAKGAIA